MSGIQAPLSSPALPPSSLVSPAAGNQSQQVESERTHIGPFQGSRKPPESETTQKTKGCSQPILKNSVSSQEQRALVPKRMTGARPSPSARPASGMGALRGGALKEARGLPSDDGAMEAMNQLAGIGSENSQGTSNRTSMLATDIFSANDPSEVLSQQNPTVSPRISTGQPSRPSPPSKNSQQTSTTTPTQPNMSTDAGSAKKTTRPARQKPPTGGKPDMTVIGRPKNKSSDNLQSMSSDRTNGTSDSEEDPLAAMNRLADAGAAAPTKSDMSIGTGPPEKAIRPGPKSTRRASQGQQAHMSGVGRPKNKPSGNLQSTSSDRTNGASDSEDDPLAEINKLSLKAAPDVGPAPIRERPARSPDERQTLGTLEHHEVLQQKMPKAGGEPKVKLEESPDKSTYSNGLISGLKTFFGRFRP